MTNPRQNLWLGPVYNVTQKCGIITILESNCKLCPTAYKVHGLPLHQSTWMHDLW